MTTADAATSAAAPPLPRQRGTGLLLAAWPGDHPSVRNALPEDGSGPRLLQVPRLPAAWASIEQLDVFHLHVGIAAHEPDPRALLDALQRRQRPLVLTLHDASDTERLGVLVPGAAAIVCLSSDVAEEVRARWGRDCVVVPHPHVVPLPVMQQASAVRDVRRRGGRALQFRVGLLADAGALADAVHDASGTPLPVDARADLRSARLWSDLASLDALVLPAGLRGATTWLEACRDLGVTCVAPVGLLPSTAPALTFDGPSSIGDVLREVYAGRVPQPPGVELRRRQRAAVAAVHADVYARVVNRVG